MVTQPRLGSELTCGPEHCTVYRHGNRLDTFSALPCIRGHMSQGTYGRLMRWSLVLLLAWPLLAWAATPDALDAVHYHVDVTYDAATHTLHGSISCTAIGRGAHPLAELYFLLPPTT